MNTRYWQPALAATLLLFCSRLPAEESSSTTNNPLAKIPWQTGPISASLDKHAEIKVPAGFIFTDGNGTRQFMELLQNPPSKTEVGLMAPDGLDWFVVFEFSSIGYVKDDEKEKLDADAMLEAMKKGTTAGNKERQRRGWPALSLLGWQQPPQYDPDTQNLTWATLLESQGSRTVNYNTRLLGRHGVMSVTLVLSPEQFDEVVPAFRSLLKEFNYLSGQRYAEYRSGDKIAQYGLSALVLGGATAVAAKTGLLKHLGKAIILVGAAVAAFFKRLFGRKPGN